MSLFGAKKQTPPLKELLGRAKEYYEKRMAEESVSGASVTSSSHIGDLIERKGPLPTDPDVTATTSEIAREELGDYLGEPLVLPREVYNEAARVHNDEAREEGHPSQVVSTVHGCYGGS